MSILKLCVFCLSLYFVSSRVVLADEDDSMEIFEDIFIGMSMAACEENKECSDIMASMFFPILVVFILSAIICPPKEEEFEYPKPKRVVRVGASYAVGKMIFS